MNLSFKAFRKSLWYFPKKETVNRKESSPFSWETVGVKPCETKQQEETEEKSNTLQVFGKFAKTITGNKAWGTNKLNFVRGLDDPISKGEHFTPCGFCDEELHMNDYRVSIWIELKVFIMNFNILLLGSSPSALERAHIAVLLCRTKEYIVNDWQVPGVYLLGSNTG